MYACLATACKRCLVCTPKLITRIGFSPSPHGLSRFCYQQLLPTMEGFDPEAYLAVFHEATAVEDLSVGLTSLEAELGERQGQLKTLVRPCGLGRLRGAARVRNNALRELSGLRYLLFTTAPRSTWGRRYFAVGTITAAVSCCCPLALPR
jgi:hypothetical protein